MSAEITGLHWCDVHLVVLRNKCLTLCWEINYKFNIDLYLEKLNQTIMIKVAR